MALRWMLIYIYNCSEKKCLAPPNAPFQNSPANPTISGGGGVLTLE